MRILKLVLLFFWVVFFCVVSRPIFAQYKVGDRLVVISEAELHAGRLVREVLGRGQDVRVDDLHGDLLLVKHLFPGWIKKESVRTPVQALEVFTGQIAVNPLDAGAFYARGITRADLNDFDLAIADFTEAIRLAPTQACAFNGRGNCWANKGATDNAIADYTEALRLDPKAAITFANRARMWNITGEYDKANADATAAIRIAPTYASAYSVRAQASAAMKQFDHAFADCEIIFTISSPGLSGYNDVAWFLATSADANVRDGVKAVEFATKACDVTNERDGGVLDTRAVACAETGDFDQAVAWEMKAIEFSSDRDRPEFESHLSLFKSGRPLRESAN